MWADVVTTGGTTGKPVYIPFTKKDLFRNAYFIAKKFSVFGLRKDDIAYITAPVEQSMWIGGLSVWLGCLKIGACALRAGHISIDKHMEFLARFKPSVIFGLPSFVLRLGEEINDRMLQKIPKPRLIITFGENIMNKDFSRNILGSRIEKVWGAKVISGYGATEASPGFECVFQFGHHILSEMIYVEVVDPKTSKVLKPLEEGLVVITHFGREGLPLIRYANGDISFLDNRKCKCGRKSFRLGPVLGRIDEMVKIKGINIFPSQLEDLLLSTAFIKDFFIELFTGSDLCDKIRVLVEFKEGLSKREKKDTFNFLEAKLRDKFGIKMEVGKIKDYHKEARFKVKERRIIDKRIKNRS
jgi:phenylacetate-CoA ligase